MCVVVMQSAPLVEGLSWQVQNMIAIVSIVLESLIVYQCMFRFNGSQASPLYPSQSALQLWTCNGNGICE
jgi:hypothetical protein